MEVLRSEQDLDFANSLEKLMRDRRTIHQFSDRKISDGVVEKALGLSLWAPNHHVTNPWYYQDIGKSEREALSKLAVNFKNRKSPLNETQARAVASPYLTVPVLIAVGCKRSEKAQQAREDYASVAAGLQNAALYLWSLGIGTKWTSGEITRADETYSLLKINSLEIELVGFFWIGYPALVPSAIKRVSLSDIFRKA